MDLSQWLPRALGAHAEWTRGFGPFERHPSLEPDPTALEGAWEELRERLEDNYPFFHPRYAGQMLKPPHPVAVLGYLAAMLVNPNNHALDGGPATARMEREAVAGLAEMLGLPEHLGHLATSGTIANLEALWVARQTHPGRGIAYGAEAHYTHARMCGVLGVEGRAVPADASGRMDLDALEEALRGGGIGTVVLTAGSTGLGAVDPVHEALALRERYGVRLHVDAAYGGFFTLLAGTVLDPAPWRAIGACDSVVVDPHKHGLQPYGCGAVLFSDPGVGRLYLHDSPYTYFTSDELHLGEISLECSRAGAAAAALWLTLRAFPLTAEGLGRVLAPGVRAARRWAELLEGSEWIDLHLTPELDIVAFHPRVDPPTLSGVDAASARALAEGMVADDPVFLSTLRVDAAAMAAREPGLRADAGGARILRSVLMKPEAEGAVEWLHARVEGLARSGRGLRCCRRSPAPAPRGVPCSPSP